MLKHVIEAQIGRRGFLVSAGATLAAAPLSFAPSGARAQDLSALKNSNFNIRAFARMGATLEPNSAGYTLYKGKAFAVTGEGPQIPIYGIEGLGAIGTQVLDDGTIRFLFSEAAIYTDLETGDPLETWQNPLTNEVVEVWHQRNGPVNFAMSVQPEKTDTAFVDVEKSTGGFMLPWQVEGDLAYYAQDTVSNRPNPLSVEDYPDYSVGETLHISEHSQFTVKLADLLNEDIKNLSFIAALQSLKPWHPWMKMGQLPGRVFTRMSARKVSGPEELTAPVREYVEANLASYVSPPAEWTGEYFDAYRLFKMELDKKAS